MLSPEQQALWQHVKLNQPPPSEERKRLHRAAWNRTKRARRRHRRRQRRHRLASVLRRLADRLAHASDPDARPSGASRVLR